MRFGAGTQNKVLESMAVGVPVVCSRVAFNGLGVSDGQGVFLAESPEEFSSSVLRLVNDIELNKKTGELGRLYIEDQLSWKLISKKLENYFEANRTN
jgi:glycosyltransferase involved in cell wall biosynthesis